jgi:ADP-ribose pyrophosphatase YjhB (NUDIX family)
MSKPLSKPLSSKPVNFSNTIEIVLFVTRADAFLMLRKKHPEITSEVWDLPNGMLGNAESIASGAKRIAQETLALDLKKFSILSIADPIESTGFGYSIGILVESYAWAPVISDAKTFEEIRFFTEVDMPDDMTSRAVQVIENKLLWSIHPLNRSE